MFDLSQFCNILILRYIIMEELERRISNLEKDNAGLKAFENLAKRVINTESKITMKDINENLIKAAKSMKSVVFVETIVVEQEVKENEGAQTEFDRFLEMFGYDFFMPYTPPVGTGSGVILKKDLVLTNYHVVSSVAEFNYNVKVYFDDDSKQPKMASLLGYDQKLDLALIKVDTGSCPKIEIGDSDKLVMGELVLALGAPIGSRSSVSMGVFGGKKMIPWGSDLDQRLNEVLQTDADMMSGNSGGPLVDIDGKLVGINTFVRADSQTGGTLGFAIPISKAMKYINELEKNNKVVRIMIGISLDQTLGMVTSITETGGSFGKLEKNDIILKVGEVLVRPMTNDIMLNLKKGDNKLTIKRGEKEMEVIVTGKEYIWDSKKKNWVELISQM
jgi:S1-C subfamily serine protease